MTEPGDADQGTFVDRSSILRASTTRELGELLTMIDGSPFVICIHRSERRGSGTPSAISRFASHGTIKTPCTATKLGAPLDHFRQEK